MNRILTVSISAAAILVAACKDKPAADGPKGDKASTSVSAGRDAAPVAFAQKAFSPDSGIGVQVPPLVEKYCNDICERSRQLQCKRPADCMPNCQAMGILTGCSAQVVDFYKCLVQHPAAHWECDEDGVAAIREGYCEKEQEHAVACVEANSNSATRPNAPGAKP